MGELKETQEKVENLKQAIEEMSVSQEKKEHVHESKVENSAVTKEMMENRVPAFGWAARDSSGVLSPFKFSRRETGEKDVKIKVLYCGICRSDLHSIKNEWGYLTFPLMPGHEIVGEAIEVGSKVTKYKVGDKVGVGCIVGTCSTCDLCKTGKENYCPGMILTYGGIDHDGTKTHGGYSNFLVVDEDFVLRIPENLPLHAAAPLLCGGITCYSPMRYFGLDKPGLHLGVVGLGGLGHIAVKFAKAMGLKVTVISTSPAKKEGAIENLGVDAFLHSEDTEKLEASMGTMDGIIDTSPYPHKVPTVGLLKSHGKLIWVGLPKPSMQLEIPIRLVALERKIVTGSIFGPIKETQEMLDYAGNHEIKADVEVIPMDYVNKAMERLAVADVRYRFVIDVANTLKEE